MALLKFSKRQWIMDMNNNALEKVTPRRYDQIWVCSVSVAASCWIQRVNLSFESPHPTATEDKLAPALVHR